MSGPIKKKKKKKKHTKKRKEKIFNEPGEREVLYIASYFLCTAFCPAIFIYFIYSFTVSFSIYFLFVIHFFFVIREIRIFSKKAKGETAIAPKGIECRIPRQNRTEQNFSYVDKQCHVRL